MSKLVLFLADGTTLDVQLKRERTTIGRRPDNEVCLPNLAVSGEHAAVVTILADSFLEDLGSTNGTLVNGRPIAKHFLRDGDHIDIGRHILVYCVDDAAVLPADSVRAAARAALDDLGDEIEKVRPAVRAARDVDGATMRRQRAAINAAAAVRISTQHAVAEPADEAAPQESTDRIRPVQPPIASIKILSGPGRGRVIPITKPEVTIGRGGVQVALIRRNGEGFELKPLEGANPALNAQSIAADGAALVEGDVIEIAGTKMEFGGIPQASTP